MATTSLAPTEPPQLAKNGKIAFVRRDDLWVADARGKHERRLTPQGSPGNGPFYWDPSWSPDGRRIALTRTTYGGHEFNEVVVMQADGAGETPATGPNALEPTWSPDGTRLAFSALGVLATVPVESTELFDSINYVRLPEYCVMAMEAAEEDWCSDEPIYDVGFFADRTPAWSPDGTRIAFVRADEDGSWLFLAKAQGAPRTL